MYCIEEKNKLRDYIRQSYISYYIEKGIKNIPALPLRIYYDPTLSFVNCTICHMKKMYIEGKTLESYCVVQPCLRTNTYHEMHNEISLSYTASIEMLGIFQPIEEDNVGEVLKNQIIWQADFLSEILGKEFEIKVELSAQFKRYIDGDFLYKLEELKTKCCFVKTDYIWEYGMDDVIGIGSNWIIRHNDINNEFGNVIILIKDGQVLGVESGGSIEIIMQSIMKKKHKIYSNIYATLEVEKEIQKNGVMSIMYFDTMDVITRILWETKDDFHTSLHIDAVMEQYIRVLKSLGILLNIPVEEKFIDIFESCHEGWRQYPGMLKRKLKKELSKYWDINLIIKSVKESDFGWRGLSSLEKMAIKKIIAI